MEQEVEQLKALVEDLFARIESLEERVMILEDGAGSQPKGPEPILTCVHCQAEYKESENGEGYCKYHNGSIKYGFNCKLSCCNKTAKSVESVLLLPGCVKGKHRSEHHTEFPYTMYSIFMLNLSEKAKEKWLEMDTYDYVVETCMWAQVGKSSDDRIFVLAGHASPSVCATIKQLEVCKAKKSSVLFEKSDSSGWSLKAELVVSGSADKGILVTLKPAWCKVSYAQKVNLTLVDNKEVNYKSVETVSDPRPKKPPTVHTVPEEILEGPMLEPGEDFSQGRKTDYPTETSDFLFNLEMVQLKGVAVNSDTWGMKDGKWTNIFDATIKVTNATMEIVSVTDVLGEYKSAEGEWVKCKDIYVKHAEEKKFSEVKHILVDAAAPVTLDVELCIEVEGGPIPEDDQERRRAHRSLPQPLLLRTTLVDSEKRTASLILEQGNKPLPLSTKESRQASWSKKPMLFYLCADDTDLCKRSDVGIYYKEDMDLIYRPAPNGNGGTYYYVRDDMLESAAYKAKKSGEKEQEFTSLRKENRNSKIELFAVVDLEYQFTFALKVVITTPTSSATGYFLLPQKDSIFTTTLAIQEEAEVNSQVEVEWKVPFASRKDRIGIFKKFGGSSDYISSECNRKELTNGSIKMKAPTSPGVYEVRYYPSVLMTSTTGLKYNVAAVSAELSVVTA